MTPKTKIDTVILDEIHELATALKLHIAETEQYNQMTASMYKTFVTGNGVPSYQERLRNVEKCFAYFSAIFTAVVIAVCIMFATGKAVLIFK